MATLQTVQSSQPDQLNNQEAPLKSSVVISSTGPEDFNKDIPSTEQIARGLVDLHSKLDKALSKSHIFARPLNVESSIILGNPIIEERQVLSSRLYEAPRMSVPVVYETVSHSYNPFGYVHNAASQQFVSPVRTARPEVQQYSSPSVYWTRPQTAVYVPTSPSLNLSTIQFSHSAGHSAPQPVHYHQGPVIHQQLVHPTHVSYIAPTNVSYVVEPRDGNYYCSEFTNDNDSVISDHRDEVDEDFLEEQDPRVKTVGKKTAANNNNNVQPVDNGGFVRKGPYSQQKRQNISSQDAKKFFDKPGQIPNFNFGK